MTTPNPPNIDSDGQSKPDEETCQSPPVTPIEEPASGLPGETLSENETNEGEKDPKLLAPSYAGSKEKPHISLPGGIIATIASIGPGQIRHEGTGNMMDACCITVLCHPVNLPLQILFPAEQIPKLIEFLDKSPVNPAQGAHTKQQGGLYIPQSKGASEKILRSTFKKKGR